MPYIEIEGVNNFICHNINLRIEDGEFLVLLGPNGAGKTTLLNIIAGLIKYDGSIVFNDKRIDGTPSRLRRIGYVFQDLALFPHLDVKANIAFGLQAQGMNPLEIEARVKEMLHLWGIENFAHRFPHYLSGGERQKVAIARALAPHPQALLLDEPFSNLDRGTSIYLQREMKQMQRKLRITTIYVTHNQREAEELGDKIAIIHSGRIEQIGTPEEIFFNPLNENISRFIGSPNILYCESCQKLVQGLIEVKSGGLKIVVPEDSGEITKIAILPRDVYISKSTIPGPGLNRFTGEIIKMTQGPNHTFIQIQIADHTLVAEQPTEVVERMNLQAGDMVYITLMLKWIKSKGGRC